jgi:hypothetical protein
MRGLIKIRDRQRLERLSCHCYRNTRLKHDGPPLTRTPRFLLGLPFLLLALE